MYEEIEAIRCKLRARNAAELVRLAILHGFVDHEIRSSFPAGLIGIILMDRSRTPDFLDKSGDIAGRGEKSPVGPFLDGPANS